MRTLEQIDGEIERVRFALCTDFDTPGPCLKERMERLQAERATKAPRGYHQCPGCLKRSAPRPTFVKRGYQCSECANIEEGAY